MFKSDAWMIATFSICHKTLDKCQKTKWITWEIETNASLNINIDIIFPLSDIKYLVPPDIHFQCLSIIIIDITCV